MDNSTQHGNGRDHRTAQAETPAGADLLENTAEAVEQAGLAVGEKTRALGEAYRRFADSGRECVRSSPGTSILLALLAGWGLARLMFSRK